MGKQLLLSLYRKYHFVSYPKQGRVPTHARIRHIFYRLQTTSRDQKNHLDVDIVVLSSFPVGRLVLSFVR